MKTLYCLLAMPNGARKTTAAFTLLPGLLACRAFVNSAVKPIGYIRRW